MDVLWSPWRYDYIAGSGAVKKDGCPFCDILDNSANDEDSFILHRAEFNFVILNIYPYTSGHLMVIPYSHLPSLAEADTQATNEMMDLVKLSENAINSAYKPGGINIGMNLGQAAGAGVAGHYHMHVLPRWIGDVNFMTAIGQTRTLPESLNNTYDRLKVYFSQA